MTEEERVRLLLGTHYSIEKVADATAERLAKGEPRDPTYPPNGGLTAEERAALAVMPTSPELHSALRKVIAGAAAHVLFEFFNYVDGTSNPHGDDRWGCYSIGRVPDQVPPPEVFWHDAFYDTYWEWRKVRDYKGWRLDNLDQ